MKDEVKYSVGNAQLGVQHRWTQRSATGSASAFVVLGATATCTHNRVDQIKPRGASTRAPTLTEPVAHSKCLEMRRVRFLHWCLLLTGVGLSACGCSSESTVLVSPQPPQQSIQLTDGMELEIVRDGGGVVAQSSRWCIDPVGQQRSVVRRRDGDSLYQRPA